MGLRSWRLKFIDIDESMTMPSYVAGIKGYMVIRAPKGDVKPMYFPPQSQSAIEAMIGIPNAHWSDIQEAIAFNREFGLYISAPPGSGEGYASYYGGKYITKNGAFSFYEVSDKDAPNWLTPVELGSERSFNPKLTPLQIIEDTTDPNKGFVMSQTGNLVMDGAFGIEKVPSAIKNSLTKITLDYWGSDFNGSLAQTIDININGDKLFVLDAAGNEFNIGEILVDGSFYFGKGHSKSVANTDSEIPYFTFNKLLGDSYTEILKTDGSGDLNTDDFDVDEDLIRDLIINGGSAEVKRHDGGDSVIFQSIRGIEERFKWILNIKNDTYMYVVQKSPTEKRTTITINDIGYDKYRYDIALNYTTDLAGVKKSDKVYEVAGSGSWSVFDANGLVLVLKNTGATPGAGEEVLPQGIYRKDDTLFTSVTEQHLTKYVRILGQLGTGPDANFINSLKYVGRNPTGKIDIIDVGFDKATKPEINNLFNSINISVQEEVYPGTLTAGGEFLGSLSENGKDTYGGNIYWPEVLPDDAMSFVEVVPVKTFDEEDDSSLDNKGFFTGNRIVDPKGEGPNTSVNYLQGRRFISKVVQDNINNKIVGNAWRDEMSTVISQGWTEAFMPKYDDVFIFMEPTGDDNIKGTLVSLRQVQQLATIIMPKQITQSEYLNPSTIVVEARSTGTAQYVGQFLMKDPYTSKKYWTSPIGDIGTNLARIMDQKMGGWAPMWNNIAGGLGGQLARSVLEAKYDFDDTSQQIMDQKGLNPILYTADDGLMIVSQKTTLDPNSLSDWSYLGHSMSFDLCKREIRDQVMRPQIGKPIDDFYMDLRERQTASILEKRTTGSQPIWSGAKVQIKEVNTAMTKAQRDFQIRVMVKVNPFSEGVVLTFVNIAQTTML